jgi:hypothetical protein
MALTGTTLLLHQEYLFLTPQYLLTFFVLQVEVLVVE